MGKASRNKWIRRIQAMEGASAANKNYEELPWYESNLFWVPVTTVVGIILTVAAAIKNDLLWLLWVAYLLACYPLWVISQNLLRCGRGFRIGMFFSLVMFVGLGFLALNQWLEPSVNAPFRIEIPIVFLGAHFVFGHDNVASPIDVALHVQIANMQEARSTITAYAVQAAASSDGPWKSLMRLPIRNGELYMIGNGDLTNAHVYRHTDDLEEVLRARPFEPHETKVGWGFFERKDIIPSEVKFFRFRIRDSAGAETIQVVPLSKEGSNAETNFQEGSMTFLKLSDISKLQVKYYHSSYPD